MNGTDRDGAPPAPLSPHLAEAERVYREMVFETFAFELRLGHHVGFVRAFASPRVADVLLGTGVIEREPHRRATDTGLFVWELLHHGLDSPQGRTVLRRMRGMHARLPVPDEDYRWVLGLFVVPGLQMIERYGWRQATNAERQAAVDWWRAVGARWGLPDVPETVDGLAALVADYERRHLRVNAPGRHLLEVSSAVVVEPLPRPLRPLALRCAGVLVDEPARTALGLARGGAVARACVHALLRARAAWRRRRGPRPWFTPGGAHAEYPDGYTLDDLGPREA